MTDKAPEGKVGKINSSHPMFREAYDYTYLCRCGFASYGWPTRKQANIRKQHHEREHTHGELMPAKEQTEQITPKLFPPTDTEQAQPKGPIGWDEVK